MTMRLVPRVTMFVAAGVVGLAGCASETSSPTALSPSSSARLALGPTTDATPVVGQIKLCKSGTSNTSGTFAISRVAVGTSIGSALTAATLAPGECSVVAEDFTTVVTSGSNVTIDETSAGFQDGTVIFISSNAGVSGPTDLTDNSTFFVNNYHGYVITYNNTVEHPPVHPECDFITFGRLVTTVNGQKVVISGNAGGNAPGGGILGEFHVEVNGVDYHVSDITSYGPISDGALSTNTNSRIVTGTAKNGAAVELRVWDGGEPGKNTDYVAVKINDADVLAAAGQTIDQGNMQYHDVCRGPGD
jgi:hypothetical protein